MRFAIAGLLGLLVPGVGHLYIGRRRLALLFLFPVAVLVAGLVAVLVDGGVTGLVVLLVTPGVLPVLAGLNLAFAAWRLAASADAARRAPWSRASAGFVGSAMVALVLVPHLVIGGLIASTDDFLDSFFADHPTETEAPTDEPWLTPPPPVAFDYGVGGRRVDGWAGKTGAPPTPGPTPTRAPRGPYGGGGGAGSLPPLGAAVPWDAPGAIPWGNDGRFDLLLMGSDAGSDRWSRRVDVLLLVEVDVSSGKVAMIGIPRNLQNAPYPPGPARDYSSCGCQRGLINEMYVEATSRHPDRWPGSGAVKGIGAVRAVASELTGRPIDAVLIVDLVGVIRVVDAMGGVDVYVPTPVTDSYYPDPIKGSIYLRIPAGQQHMDGRTALAYARSRHSSSDYARMARQQTLLLAIRDQLGFEAILNAPSLFDAAQRTAWTDLPRSSLPALVELFAKAADASVRQLRLVPNTYPSWLTSSVIARIRADVAGLLGPVPPPTPTPEPTPSPTPTACVTPDPSASADPSAPADPCPTPDPSAPPTPDPSAPTPTPDPSATPTPDPSASVPDPSAASPS